MSALCHNYDKKIILVLASNVEVKIAVKDKTYRSTSHR